MSVWRVGAAVGTTEEGAVLIARGLPVGASVNFNVGTTVGLTVELAVVFIVGVSDGWEGKYVGWVVSGGGVEVGSSEDSKKCIVGSDDGLEVG